ncbi:MAG TPA: glycosyltransferase [Streptosporangiaceae bacterium]|nr:glycosyltransferase [Streptosporangiaceae bacterium]
MRIALVTGHAAPDPAAPRSSGTDPRGQALRVAALAATLAGLGHLVTVYARRDSPARPDSQNAGGVRFEYLPAGPAAPLPQDRLLPQLGAFSAELSRRWQQQPPDIVHAHFWTSGLAALAATRGTQIPVVQSFHSLGSQRGRPRPADDAMIRSRMERVVARAVRSVLAGSSAELTGLAGLGVPRAAITVVPFGVDTSRFEPLGPQARRGKAPRLLAAAPSSREHGLDTVIRALAALPGAELLIVGGPPRAEIGTDPILRELAELAGRAGVSNRVLFTGKISQSRIPALLRSADLFVHVASDEPTGILPVEAMACGTPVVAAEGGADQDAVVDGATGVLVAPGSASALARRIRQLLASPMLLEGFGIAAADRARSRYSWERVGQETVAAYERAG